MQVARGGDGGLRRRLVGDPDGGVAPGAHGAEEAGVGVDPDGRGGAGFLGAFFIHRDPGPDTLVGTEHRRGGAQRQAVARGQFDHGDALNAGGGSLGEFALEHDAIHFRGQRAIHLAIAARSDQGQRHHAARLYGSYQLRRRRFEQEAVDGGAGEQFERAGIGPGPSHRNPGGGRRRGGA